MFEQARRAGEITVYDLLVDRVAVHPDRPAIQFGAARLTYAELLDRIDRIASVLLAAGAAHGERVALLSENRWEFLAGLFACARIGAIAACMNWRQSVGELAHCANLVSPKVALVSARFIEHEAMLRAAGATAVLNLDDGFAERLAAAAPAEAPEPPRAEDGFQIIYTSGTTGKPKGALISHRALIARFALSATYGVIGEGDTFIAWPPMFHTAGTEYALMTVLRGGKVIVVDGAKIDQLCDLLETEDNIGWFNLMPGMIDRMLEAAAERGLRPRPVRMIGSAADLIPRQAIAASTALFQAPFRNTFASTECGPVPGTGNMVPIGEVPDELDKFQTTLCRIRLVDDQGRDVPPGEPGEMLVRSPTLFSGYWNAPEVNAEVFAGGWFHTGDVLVRTSQGKLRFVNRRKYLIKSGGENIYPGEIEAVLMASPRIHDAIVVRKQDARWGEIPVAFVIRRDETLTEDDVIDLCQGHIARYKLPRQVVFVRDDEVPRNITGKPLRDQLEARLEAG